MLLFLQILHKSLVWMQRRWHGSTESRSRPKKQSLPARTATSRVSTFFLAFCKQKKSSRTRRLVMGECVNAKGCQKRPWRRSARTLRSKCNTSTQTSIYTHIYNKGTTLVRWRDVIARMLQLKTKEATGIFFLLLTQLNWVLEWRLPVCISRVRTTHKCLALCEGLGHPRPLILSRAVCATHALSPSARSIGLCAIWVCISSSYSDYNIYTNKVLKLETWVVAWIESTL
jgi:hypothetical protein